MMSLRRWLSGMIQYCLVTSFLICMFSTSVCCSWWHLIFQSSGQFLPQICAPCLIHLLLTHLMPREVGHAPCRERASLSCCRLSRLYQNTAEPALGLAATPISGNAVKPPLRSDR